MKISQPFVIRILNKVDVHPLQAASDHSGEKMVKMVTLNGMGASEYTPTKRESAVVATDLVLPAKDTIQHLNLPEFLQIRKGARADLIKTARNTLWLRVEWREKRADAQYCRKFELAMPTDIPLEAAREALTSFAESSLAAQGMVADLAIHEARALNPATGLDEVASRTGYLMCTTRPFVEGKFANKERAWNDRGQLLVWRKAWFDILRLYLPPQESPSLSQGARDLWKFALRFGAPVAAAAPATSPEPAAPAAPSTRPRL